MPYAYWPPGVYWFDEARVELVCEEEWRNEMAPDQAAQPKDRNASPEAGEDKEQEQGQQDNTRGPPEP
mgnify:CR=1 FL=1